MSYCHQIIRKTVIAFGTLFNDIHVRHDDGAGNVIGRYGSPDKPAIIVGSHIDSVPAGGIFDGTLGILSALECIRKIKENNIQLNNAIEIIATSEEEGRFGGMLGAQALTGNLTLDWLETTHDANGELLKDAMARCGLDYKEAMHAKKPKDSMVAFIELHIEQGPVLDLEKKTIGVVEGISGVFKWLVKLIGKADHAGTAPMNMRSVLIIHCNVYILNRNTVLANERRI